MARFLLDEHISPKVATLMRKAGVDALCIADSSWSGWKDPEVLDLAIKLGRIVVTCNLQHFAPLIVEAVSRGDPPPGIVFVDDRTFSRRDFSGLARALVRLHGRIDRGEVDPSFGVFLTR